ncbi:hypothetical protein DVH24_037626 [Malus domestica]|uniref:Uncharacterized protein n=1 Tax=Malus domestica TaxID=3750 RepID=A0A498J3E8_MALDO|nr:hypothetical protein DVH24_037626 [Malus domestica]
MALATNHVLHSKAKHIEIERLIATLFMREFNKGKFFCSLLLLQISMQTCSLRTCVHLSSLEIVPILCLAFCRMSLKGDDRVDEIMSA